MNEQVTMSVGVALVLGEVTRMLLYKREGENFIDRDLPFRLKYRLNKNKMMLDKDSNDFNRKRLLALSKYGTMTEDGENVIITDEKNRELFQKEISDLIDSTVTHPLSLLEPADIDLVKDTDMPISPEAMSIFINYMVDDPSIREDISFKVNVSNNLPPVSEKEENDRAVSKIEAPIKEKTEEVNVEPNTVVETPVEEKPKKKTTRAKKAVEKKEDLKVEEPKTETKKTSKKTEEVKEKKTTSKKKTTKKGKING